tara:strand:+ start:11781 stop:11888 length:108 start_codon:yes stop_codon:yes gene_type:complete
MSWWLDIFVLILVLYFFYRLRQVEKEVHTMKMMQA